MNLVKAKIAENKIIVLLFAILLGCESPTNKLPDRIVTNESAQGFHLQQQPDGWDLSLIRFYQDVPDTLRYEFRRSPAPGQIPWPARRIVTLSATHAGMVIMADAREAVVGVDSKDFLFDQQLLSKVESGEIIEVGQNGQMDLEKVLEVKPDLVLISGFPDGASRDLVRLGELGIPLLPVAEWQESHPLARADWALVVAMALDKTEQVQQQLDSIYLRYHQLAEAVPASQDRPMILTGSPFQGTWYVPAGNSFLATLVHDAGGRTAWEAEPGTGSLPFDPEVVYPVGLQSAIWINPGVYQNQAELLGAFPRYQPFPAIAQQQVYNYYKQALPSGANAYWEEGPVRPDLVLKDLMTIFHPDLMEDSSLTYYRRLSP